MTSAERWSEIQRVLDGALDRSSETRTTFIAESCGADADLHEQVLRLLKACERAEQRESLLATPAAELALPIIADPGANAEGRRTAMMGTLKEALSQRYDVQRVIGLGGMSTVFLAQDLRHDREVAVKVLERDVLAPGSVERFLKEIRVTARLNHPHVLPVHDSGEVEGLLYYVTPYVDGETLRTRLNSGSTLSLPEILRLLRELADALAFAHARGVVHRDLKPENVLLSGGHAVVGDFGIAQALTDAAGPRTMPGATSVVLGTPAYMAPEQADDTIPADQRCDLYAFGLVAYELLAGVHPFSGRSARAMVKAQLDEMPESLDSLRPDLPPPLVALVMRCLAKSPAGRPANAGAVLALLDESLRQFDARRRPRNRRAVVNGLAAAGVLAISAAAWTALRPDRSLLARLSPSDSLVVADFVVRGADSLLGSTIADWVRTDLRQSNVVTVVSDGTIRAALGRMRRPAGTPLVSDIARELAQREGFTAVVEGEFQALGNGYLITLRLVSAEGDQLASFPATASRDELLPTIGQLTHRLRRRIGESLEHVRSSPPLPQVTSRSIAALRKYAEGTRALGENNHVLAVQLLNEAVALDSTFAMAWVALSAAYVNGNYPQDRSHHALERAYRNRDRLPERERYRAEGMYFRVGPSRDRARAALAYERGLQMDTAAFANSLGLLFQSRREYARAESLFRWYYDGDRNAQVTSENLANALYFQGKREEAETVEAETSRRFPNPERWARASWYLYNRGQMDSAQGALERQRTEGDATQRRFAWLQLSSLHLVRGRMAEAERARTEAAAANLARGIPRDTLAEQLWLASLDNWHRHQPERALSRLERALARSPLASQPLVSPLVGEPYHILVARIYAQARRPDLARAVLAEFTADVRDTVLKRASEPAVHSVRGEIALAEGRPLVALQEFRRADQLPDGPAHLFALGLHADVGRAFDQAGMIDSAIATFELYLETPQLARLSHDAVYLAPILQRLGALYEVQGNRTKAIEFYERLTQLWRNADLELQPRVAEVRRRAESLRSTERP